MARIGVFYCAGFDPGAYTVALYHVQAALAGTAHGLSLHTFTAGGLAHEAERNADAEGLLVFGAEGDDLEALRCGKRPAVVCERVVEGCSYVAPDNYDMGAKAAGHLLGLGHRLLAVALPGERERLGEYHGTRLRGFSETAEGAGCPVGGDRVLLGDKTQAAGEEIAAQLLTGSELPHGLYMQNLSQTLGLLRVLRRRGVRVPEDLSVVGTSFRPLNAPEATAHTEPPLTVVTFEKGEMGRRAVRYLVDAVEGRATGQLRALLPGVVVERLSTARRREPVECGDHDQRT